MRSVWQGATVLCVVVVSGCGTASDTASPRRALAEPSFSAVGVEQRVTGNAAIVLPTFDNAPERYSLSALRRADGAVTGELEETSDQQGGQRIHAQVYCLTVTGNTARLAARIDQTNVPFGPTGSYVIWSVIDNGEGAKSAPDQTTDLFFTASESVAQAHCRTGLNLAPYYSSLRGNLQVQ